MPEIESSLHFQPDGDEEAGEFLLAHVNPAPAESAEEERERFDEQILAALVSP